MVIIFTLNPFFTPLKFGCGWEGKILGGGCHNLEPKCQGCDIYLTLPPTPIWCNTCYNHMNVHSNTYSTKVHPTHPSIFKANAAKWVSNLCPALSWVPDIISTWLIDGDHFHPQSILHSLNHQMMWRMNPRSLNQGARNILGKFCQHVETLYRASLYVHEAFPRTSSHKVFSNYVDWWKDSLRPCV